MKKSVMECCSIAPELQWEAVRVARQNCRAIFLCLGKQVQRMKSASKFRTAGRDSLESGKRRKCGRKSSGRKTCTC